MSHKNCDCDISSNSSNSSSNSTSSNSSNSTSSCNNCKSSCVKKDLSCPLYVISKNKIYKLYDDNYKLIYLELESTPDIILLDYYGNLYYVVHNKIFYYDIYSGKTTELVLLNAPKPHIISSMTLVKSGTNSCDTCDSNLYIADCNNNLIYIITDVITTIDLKEYTPISIAYDKCKQILYVATCCNKILKICSSSSTTSSKITCKLELKNECDDEISSILINCNHELLVISKNNSIYKLINDEFHIFAQKVFLKKPQSSCVDKYNNIYVTNSSNNNIVKIDSMSFQSIYNSKICDPTGLTTSTCTCT